MTLHNYIDDWREVANNNDGCTSFIFKYIAKVLIKRNYCTICIQHDFDYRYGWKYGIPRKEADSDMRDGVIASGHPKIAALMHTVVRTIGWLFYKKS